MPTLKPIKGMKKQREPLPKSSMSSIWTTSFGPATPEAIESCRVSDVTDTVRPGPISHLPSFQYIGGAPNNSTSHVQPNPNPFNDPLSEVSTFNSIELPNRGLRRVLSRYRIRIMTRKIMKLKREFVIALVVLQFATMSTAAAVAIIFEQIRSGVKAGVFAWLAASLAFFVGAGLAAVITYWKREKLRREGGAEIELENCERGEDGRVKEEWIKELEGRNLYLAKRVEHLTEKLKHTDLKLKALLGQEDIEAVSSPAKSREVPDVTAKTEPASTLLTLPALNFNVDPQPSARSLLSSVTIGTGHDKSGLGVAASGDDTAISGTEGWETVIGTDTERNQSMTVLERVGRIRQEILDPQTLKSMSREERLQYWRRRQITVDMRKEGERI